MTVLETRRNPLDGHIVQEMPEIVQIGLEWKTPRIQQQQNIGSVSRELQSRERQIEEEEAME